MLAKLSKLSVREKIGVAVAALMFFLLFLDWKVAGPTAARMTELNQLIENEEREFRMGMAVLGTHDAVAAEYDQVKRLIDLPLSSERIRQDTLDGIFEAARNSGITLDSTPENRESVNLGPCDEYRLELKDMDMDMIRLLRFMSELRASKGLYRVVKMEIRPGRTENAVSVKSLEVGRTVLKTEDMAAPRKAE